MIHMKMISKTRLVGLIAPLAIVAGCSAPSSTPTPLAEASHPSSCNKDTASKDDAAASKTKSTSTSSKKSDEDGSYPSVDEDDDEASLRLAADDTTDDDDAAADDEAADKPKSSSKTTSTAASGSHLPVTYESDIRKIIDDSCVSCHGAGGQDPDLSTKKKVDDVRRSVVDSIADKSMPPDKPLSTSLRNLAADWKTNGYKAGNPGEASVLGSSSSSDATAASDGSSKNCN